MARNRPPWLSISRACVCAERWAHLGQSSASFERPERQNQSKVTKHGPIWGQIGPASAQFCRCWPGLGQFGPCLLPNISSWSNSENSGARRGVIFRDVWRATLGQFGHPSLKPSQTSTIFGQVLENKNSPSSGVCTRRHLCRPLHRTPTGSKATTHTSGVAQGIRGRCQI